MMNFEEYREKVMADILSYLPEDYKGAEVWVRAIQKNNDIKLYGLIVIRNDSQIGELHPNVYLESFYEDYIHGGAFEENMKDISKLIIDNTSKLAIGLEIFEWEKSKDHIMPLLISAEKNQEMLSEVPHRQFGDLAVHYYLEVIDGEDGCFKTTVSNKLMQIYQVNEEELFQTAVKNLQENDPPQVVDILRNPFVITVLDDEKLKQIPDMWMLAIKNEREKYGAASIIIPGYLKHISEVMGGELYLIPSSTNEFIIMKNVPEKGFADLLEIIHEMNEEEIPPEERLSDHLYRYNPEKDQIEIVVTGQQMEQGETPKMDM